MARRAVIPLLAVVALLAAGCGSQEIDLDEGEAQNVSNGAELFSENCSGCHSLDAVGAQGSNVSAGDKETTDGPNFNDRREDRDGVLYAIRNGGFSGAIMPQDIVVGKDAEAVAAFLSKYAGHESKDARSE